MTIDDLQPKGFKIKIRDTEYDCKPLRLSHKLILDKLKPFFQDIENAANEKELALSAKDLISMESEIDVLIGDLIPTLSNITLGMEDLADILVQMINSVLPTEVQELKEAKVEVNSDPKVQKA